MYVRLSVISKKSAQTDKLVFQRLMELTNGRLPSVEIHGSAMKVAMEREFGYYRSGICVLARARNIIIGWALVEKQLLTSDHQIAVYVAHEHRRRGIGTKLVKRATREISGRIVCWPTDICGDFFQTLDIPTDNWESYDEGASNEIRSWVHSLHK